MKILLATTAIIPKGGGIASYNQELLRTFRTVASFSVLTEENLSEYDGVEKIYSVEKKSFFSMEYCRKIVEIINEDHYDIIINSSSLLISIITPYVNAPICTISHFVNGKLALLAGFNYKYLSKIVSLSFYGKQYIEDTFFLHNQNLVHVVYNFVHTNTEIVDLSKMNQRPLIIVYPGGTSIKKSFDVVMKALRKLIKTNLNFNFYWLGGTTLPSSKICLASNVEKLIRKDDRVVFTGRIPRNEAVSLLKSANVFLLPSRGEGCPMTLLEAIQNGCIPVVSDAKHGSREILENGNFGLIIKNNDYKSLFYSLCDILKYPDKYAHNYTLTFEYSRNNLSEKKWSDSMRSILSECVKSKKIYIDIDKKFFYKNIRCLKMMLLKERIKTIYESLKSSIICNWLYITK